MHAVDSIDRIYVGYWEAGIIQIFTRNGGEAVRQISCTGYSPTQIYVIELNERLVVRGKDSAIHVVDVERNVVHHELKEKIGINMTCHAVGTDGTILVALFNEQRDRVSIKRYTSELKYI